MYKHKIVFTGGGSAGHVTPNLAIISELEKNEWDVHYIGSFDGIEKTLVTKEDIQYYGISSGKLRRYFDTKNFSDPFRIIKGIFEARALLKKIKPICVFSKGGFVTVPVVLAARQLKIPVFLHESDLTPGLANKIAQRFATKIFVSFKEATLHFQKEKTIYTGSPIRRALFEGNSHNGKQFLKFDSKKPVLTIMGGSLGARLINSSIRSIIEPLCDRFQIVHLCGKDDLDLTLNGLEGYRQFEYVNEELSDILAATDFVITRGGSNALFEFLALGKPMIIIPLSKKKSRGDQILNAQSFVKNGYALYLEEEDLSESVLLHLIDELIRNANNMKAKMSEATKKSATSIIIHEINKLL